MNKTTKDKTILILPDGPIAEENGNYKYSKGERLYIDNLAKDFKEVYLATFVLRKGSPFYETVLHSEFEAKNIKIIELPSSKYSNPSVFKKILQFIRVFKVIARTVKQVDVCYVFLPSYPSAFGAFCAKIARKPHIVYGADDWVSASESMFRWDKNRMPIFYRAYAKLNEWMEKKIVSSALFSVAAGGQLVEKYQRLGCISFPTTPRMTLTSSDIRERFDTCSGEVIQLVNVGNLIHDKDQHTLLEAFALAREKDNRLRLLIIGEGPEKAPLKNLTKKLEIDNYVTFTGYIESEFALYEFLSNSDVFVLSSITEGFPRVLYEAMCMRLPIVSTKVGGVPYLMKHQQNALLVECGNKKELAEALVSISRDGKLRREIIKNASKTLDDVFVSMGDRQISGLLCKYM